MKMNLDDLQDNLIYKLSDNSDWEYTREGIGFYEGRVFIVDLNDTGEDDRQLHFVEEGLQVHQVLAAGKQTGRYWQDPSGVFYYNWDTDGDEKVNTAFRLLVGI
jgi:hypothetical protein